jgi:hypothetical protein
MLVSPTDIPTKSSSTKRDYPPANEVEAKEEKDNYTSIHDPDSPQTRVRVAVLVAMPDVGRRPGGPLARVGTESTTRTSISITTGDAGSAGHKLPVAIPRSFRFYSSKSLQVGVRELPYVELGVSELTVPPTTK